MRKSGTGGIQQNLKTGGSTSATIAPSGNLTFQLNDLMDRSPTGPLALYLTALLLTVSGTLVQAGGAGTAVPRDRLPGLLFDSVDWTNSWMGSPAAKFVFNGARLPIVEFVAGGFQYAQRQINQIPAANGTYSFALTVRIPALNDRRGRLVKETSNLALLYQPSQFKVTLNPTSTLTSFTTGASWGTLTASLTAQLDVRQELVLGTPFEWNLHTPVSGGPQVVIQGFGRDSALSGVKPKGGVAFLGDLSLVNGLGGVVTPTNFTDFQFQWRGQPVTNDMRGWVQQFLDLLPNDRPQISAGTNQAAAGINDLTGFPYSINTNANSVTPDTDAILFWPLAMGGDDLELTDLQTAESDQTFNATQTGGFGAGNHQILAQYARQWEPEKVADWIAQITRGGQSSLASYVLQGPANVNAALARVAAQRDRLPIRRRPNSKHYVSADQETYLPYQFI